MCYFTSCITQVTLNVCKSRWWENSLKKKVYFTTLQGKKVLHIVRNIQNAESYNDIWKTKLNVVICLYFMMKAYDQFSILISNNLVSQPGVRELISKLISSKHLFTMVVYHFTVRSVLLLPVYPKLLEIILSSCVGVFFGFSYVRERNLFIYVNNTKNS